MPRFRVTYHGRMGYQTGVVDLSEVIVADDIEDAFDEAKQWASRRDWILISVEELEWK